MSVCLAILVLDCHSLSSSIISARVECLIARVVFRFLSGRVGEARRAYEETIEVRLVSMLCSVCSLSLCLAFLSFQYALVHCI